MQEEAISVPYGQMPTVLLLGNGVNRAFGFASWDELLASIQVRELSQEQRAVLKQVPYPLQPVILTNDHLATQMKIISKDLFQVRAPEEEEGILRDLASLPLDAILTGNYTYELEKALCGDFKCLPGRPCKQRKLAHTGSKFIQRQLHTWFDMDGFPSIWHIHGEASRHDTMILGHYYYGRLLAQMQHYISDFLRHYRSSVKKEAPLEIRSWIDYFLIGNVHIVGLGLDLSELDLWWLINCKKNHFPNTKIILHKPDVKVTESLLADAYGVIVDAAGWNGDYRAYYRQLVDRLRVELAIP